MNIETVYQLLEVEDNKGVVIYLTTGREERATKIDRDLTSGNLLGIVEPTKKVINLNYVVAIEPIQNKTRLPIIK